MFVYIFRYVFQMVSQVGFAPTIFCVKGRHVRLLHYWDLKMVPEIGIDPTTFCSSGRRSTN